MSLYSRRSDELLMKALQDATDKGYLHQIPLDHPILTRGLSAMDKKEEADMAAAKAEALAEEARRAAELVEWPHWGNYRLILGEGEQLQAVYFGRKPTYQEKKAFCAAAGVSPEKVEIEERL